MAYDSGDVDLLGELLSHLGLRQIGGHNDSVLPSVGHLVEVVENAIVALPKLHTLRKEHRRVAMGVEGQRALMHLLGLPEEVGLLNEPAEEDAVGRPGCDLETRTAMAHRLVVETVDTERVGLFAIGCVDRRQHRLWRQADRMGSQRAVGVLRMFDGSHHTALRPCRTGLAHRAFCGLGRYRLMLQLTDILGHTAA